VTAERGVTIDKARLIKLLSRTESEWDAEVLLAIRKSNELLRASNATWADIIEPSDGPAAGVSPEPEWNFQASRTPPRRSADAQPGYERSERIRDVIRREFPMTLVFFPVWIAAELVAVLFPGSYWNKQAQETVVAFWSLCGLGVVSWFGMGAYLLSLAGG
jgi:hypothetical protein